MRIDKQAPTLLLQPYRLHIKFFDKNQNHLLCNHFIMIILQCHLIHRVHGVRIMVAEKNIGRRVYSINQLQAQFLPLVYRPPKEVLEDLMRKDDT